MTKPERTENLTDEQAEWLASLATDTPANPRYPGALRAGLLAASMLPQTEHATPDQPWQTYVPGVKLRKLGFDPVEGIETNLWKLARNAVIPAHEHSEREECVILRGALDHDGVRYGQGDLVVAEAGSRHVLFRAPEPTQLLIRSEPVPWPAWPLRMLWWLFRR